MTAPAADSKLTLPYGPFSTFTSFIESLNSTVVPPLIDTSIMSRMSGTAKYHVRATLRFMGLISETGATSLRFHELVRAYGTPDWKPRLADVLSDAYRPIVGDLDLDTATLKQLVDRFRENSGISGSVLRKAIRFYLDAFKATGATFSPHFSVRGLSIISGDRVPRTNGKPKAPASPPAGESRARSPEREHKEKVNPPGETLVVQLPGREPMHLPLPSNLTEDEWTFINNHVSAYMKLMKGKAK